MDIPDNPRDITEPQRCPRCEYTWDVLGLHEHGNWNPYNEDDLICPDCGRDLMEEEKMNHEVHPERHYYLYAKGHYKEGSLEMDLRKIQSHYCNVDAEALTMRDVNCILQKLVYSHIKSDNAFFKFMDYLRRQPYYGSFELNVARACLIILSDATIYDIDFPLCAANPDILPLRVSP